MTPRDIELISRARKMDAMQEGWDQLIAECDTDEAREDIRTIEAIKYRNEERYLEREW